MRVLASSEKNEFNSLLSVYSSQLTTAILVSNLP
jgi:hypothetical protein